MQSRGYGGQTGAAGREGLRLVGAAEREVEGV